MMRICVHLTKLNESVRREIHPLPSVDYALAKFGGAKIFSKMDANSAFWQRKLSKESQLLTTFITRWGRFFSIVSLMVSQQVVRPRRTIKPSLKAMENMENNCIYYCFL